MAAWQLLVILLLSVVPSVHSADFLAQWGVAPIPAILNQTVVYSINITNVSTTDLAGMIVTNTLPDVSGLQAASATKGTIDTKTAGRVLVNIGTLSPGQSASISINFLVTSAVALTNQFSIWAKSVTNPVTVASLLTNTVTPVIGISDVGITLQGPTQYILPGDQLAYAIGVTNSGPNPALQPSVAITIPSGLTFGSLSPTNISYRLTNQTVTATLTNLSSGGHQGFVLNLQATSAGKFFLNASLSATNNLDPASTNNTSILSVTIDPPSTNLLAVNPISAQRFNPQTGAMEQYVRVINPGLSTISGFRISASGVTNVLLEAVGTNYSLPYAVYPGTLGPGESVDLLLSFFAAGRQPVNSLVYLTTVEGSNLAPIPMGTTVRPSAGVWLNSKGFLVEFPATIGGVYAVVYSSDAAFSDATVSRPYVTANTSRPQWIDTGPPRTLSHPTNSENRFYKVIQLR
jgi:uncharacterized repeat protein (TIGR01451 family)